jgi:pimeloyl-ACP methyl ester carboxylesterase
MPKQRSTPITFIVPGQATVDASASRGAPDAVADFPGGLASGEIKHSVQLRATRGSGPDSLVEAMPGQDVVVVQIAGGPSLVLHPETARDLLLAQTGTRSRGKSDAIAIPQRLQWDALDDGTSVRGTRGAFGDVLLSAIHVVGGVVKKPAADFTAARIAEIADDQVANRVYSLDPRTLPSLKEKGTPLDQLPATSTDGPTLVFVHGTFSTTQAAFQKLWTNHPDQVARIFRFYGNRVFALDHPTLGVSPIDNALTLVKALRPNTRLHLLTHSRGGLVAEVLAKLCGNPEVSADAATLFKGQAYAGQLAALKELASIVRQRKIVVERVVRAACPARGTLLASRRLDAYVSVLKWGLELAGIPVAPQLVDFLGAVAQRRTDPAILPGLAAQVPDSPLIRWLHSAGADIPGDLRVIAGDLAGDSVSSWVKTLIADAFYWSDNDLVVQTRGMYGGAPRKAGATFLLDQGGTVNHFNYFTNERSADAVVNALTESIPQGFKQIGPLSWAGQS